MAIPQRLSDEKMIWIGQGPIIFGDYDPAKGTPENGYLVNQYRIGCGNSALTTNLARTTTTLSESCSGQRLSLKQFETAKTLTVSLTMYQFSGRTLARALYGSAIDTEDGTVTDEILPPLQDGDYFTTMYPDIGNLVITDSNATTPVTYVENTNYAIESARHARVRLLEHPVSHMKPLKASYSYASHVNIAAFSKSNIQTGIIFNGLNDDGQYARIIIPRVSLAIDGDLSWIGDAQTDLTLSGEALFVEGLENVPQFGSFMRVDLMPKPQ